MMSTVAILAWSIPLTICVIAVCATTAFVMTKKD
jgi:hypothetical protein